MVNNSSNNNLKWTTITTYEFIDSTGAWIHDEVTYEFNSDTYVDYFDLLIFNATLSFKLHTTMGGIPLTDLTLPHF
jgi:hypothetical protein